MLVAGVGQPLRAADQRKFWIAQTSPPGVV
jgi:hypothetical protein